MTHDTGNVISIVSEKSESCENGASPQDSPAAEDPQPPLEDSEQPLPRWALFAMCLCNIGHFYSVCSLFSYAGVMCVDLGWAEDRDQAGFVAGFLASANTLGRMPTAALWGFLGRRLGLRYCLALSMVSIGLGELFFGLSTDLHLAVAARFLLLGAGNGWVTIFPVLAFELGGSERQTEVVGICFAAGTVIQLLGPAIGGWTYGLSPRFPALVPNCLGLVLVLAGFVAAMRWLPRDTVHQRPGHGQGKSGQVSLSAALCTKPMPFLTMLRSVQGMVNFAFFEVVPLWAISTLELGGLGLSEDDLGVVLSASALGTALYMVRLMPLSAKWLGLRRSACLASTVCALFLGLIPFVPGKLSLIFVHMVTNATIGQLGAHAVAFINNSSPPEQRSLVTGVTVTFEALGKGAGPLFSSIAFAFSLVEFGRSGHAVVFEGLSIVLLLLLLGIAALPDVVEGRGGPPAARQGPTLVATCTPKADKELEVHANGFFPEEDLPTPESPEASLQEGRVHAHGRRLPRKKEKEREVTEAQHLILSSAEEVKEACAAEAALQLPATPASTGEEEAASVTGEPER